MTADRPESRLRLAVNAVGLAPGGGLTFLVNQAREFERDGDRWDVTYFVAPRSASRLQQVVERGRVRVPFRRPPGYARRLWWEQVALPRVLAQEGFDLLYSPGGFAVFGSPVPQLVVHQNAHHFATIRDLGWHPLLIRLRVEREVAKRSARRAEAFVVLTNAVADGMKQVGFPPPTAVVHSGLPDDWPEPAREVPLSCPVCDAGEFALAVHNWGPPKRIEWLAEIWAQHPELARRHLVIVGGPTDARVEKRVRSVLARSEVAAVVHSVREGTRDVVAALYQRAHLYLSASVLESFGLTLLEAMSFGVPCVVSDIPAHREVAEDAAEFFRIDDAASLIAAVKRVDARRDGLVDAGRRRVRGWTWRAHVDALQVELESLLR